jgi:hypothetical protein
VPSCPGILDEEALFLQSVVLTHGREHCDGSIAVYKGRKVRVRIAGDIATVAIKGPRIGIVRPEFECEIPIVDAERVPVKVITIYPAHAAHPATFAARNRTAACGVLLPGDGRLGRNPRK